MKIQLLSLSLLCSSSVLAQDITLINPFEVPTVHEKATIEHWEKARDFLETQPGYVSTQLHKSLQPNSTFFLINIAQWESKEDFQRAISNMQKVIPALELDGVKNYPALYEVIRN